MDLSAFDLKGKVALITGGAHGIGFSIAVGMASCGATVCFNCSNEGSLEKGLAAYKEAGVDAHGYVADVTDEAAVNAMVAKIKEALNKTMAAPEFRKKMEDAGAQVMDSQIDASQYINGEIAKYQKIIDVAKIEL